MNPRTTFFLAASLLTVLGASSPAAAQDWPTRPVLVVSPFTAGSANDIVARLVLDQVGQQIGQAFVVENRPGGGGIVGVASVVRAEPDWCLSSSPYTQETSVRGSLRQTGQVTSLGCPWNLAARSRYGLASQTSMVPTRPE